MKTSEPIRIAHIMGKLLAGGVESVAFNYYRNIDKSKIQFDFYYDEDSTVEPPRDLIEMGARFIKVPPYQSLNRYQKTLDKYFKENNYTIVHSHINTLSVFPLYVAWKNKIPVRIAHNHSVPGGDQYFRNFLKYFLRPFAKVFATDYFSCSEKAGRWLFGNKSFDEGKVFVLKNAIDFDTFTFNKAEKEQFRESLGLTDNKIVGHVGRFTYPKNHTMLLQIFKELYSADPSYRLLLVGDGELRRQITKTISQLGIDDAIILTGKVSDPQKYYSIMDILIFPSFYEGLGLTTVEAQAAGVPVLMSDVVPNDAVISDAYKKLNVKHDPVSKWAEEASALIGTPSHLTEHKNEYNIKTAAPWLTKWYLDKLRKNGAEDV